MTFTGPHLPFHLSKSMSTTVYPFNDDRTNLTTHPYPPISHNFLNLTPLFRRSRVSTFIEKSVTFLEVPIPICITVLSPEDEPFSDPGVVLVNTTTIPHTKSNSIDTSNPKFLLELLGQRSGRRRKSKEEVWTSNDIKFVTIH